MQTLRHYNQGVIAEEYDESGNTLGHIAAKCGTVELFKVHCTNGMVYLWLIQYALIKAPLT